MSAITISLPEMMSRKTAIDQLHAERYRRGFRALFRTLYKKADVRVPEFPEMERLDAVSPPRAEDEEVKGDKKENSKK